MKSNSTVVTRRAEPGSKSIDHKIKMEKPLNRKSSNKILIEPISEKLVSMASTKIQPNSSGKNPKKYLLKVYSSQTSLNVGQKSKRKKARRMLKQAKILRAILRHLEVYEVVSKIACLSKSTRTQ